MARSKKSHEADEEKVRVTSGSIEPPYSYRVDGHRYVVYAKLKRSNDNEERILVRKFLAKYAAKKFIDLLVGNDTTEEGLFMGHEPHNWKHMPMVTTSSGIRIMTMGKDFLELLHYQPTKPELEWTDDQLEKAVHRFRFGKAVAEYEAEETEQNRPVTRKEKAPKTVKPKVDTTGHVSANAIATELKAQGREIRGVLRSLKLEKPDHGWSWPQAEAEQIKKKIIEELKRKK